MAATDEPDLDRLERQWRAISVVVIEATIMLAMLGLAAAVLSRGSGNMRFTWLPLLPASVLVLVTLAVFLRPAPAFLLTGALLLVFAVVFGVMSQPAPHPTGRCKSVIGGIGRYGDDDETCYDLRSARLFDVAATAAAGLLCIGAGVVVHSTTP